MRNIVIVNDHAHNDGGASSVAISSAIALAGLGKYQVYFFAAVQPISPALIEAGVKVICTNQCEILKDPSRLRAATQGIWNVQAAHTFTQLLDSLDQSDTIIHLHYTGKALSSSIARTAIDKNFSLICTLHDYSLVCPNGAFYNHSQKKICHLTPMTPACLVANCDSRSYAQKAWRIARQFVQNNFGQIPYKLKHFIPVSEFSRKILAPHLPANAIYHHVPNPIDMTDSGRVAAEHNQKVVYIGRLFKEKGGILLAQAANILNISIAFIGEGEEKSKIKALSPQSETLGWLDKTAIKEHLQTARMLVLPSLWYETQGLVVLEALTMGIPVIVPDQCAASDFVIDGENGLYFQTGNATDLAAKIKVLREDNALLESMSHRAYSEYWANPATISTHIENLLKAYEVVMSVN